MMKLFLVAIYSALLFTKTWKKKRYPWTFVLVWIFAEILIAASALKNSLVTFVLIYVIHSFYYYVSPLTNGKAVI